jgi:hypothetical protein
MQVLPRQGVGSTYLTNDGLVFAVRGEIRRLLGTHRHGPTARAQSAAGVGGGAVSDKDYSCFSFTPGVVKIGCRVCKVVAPLGFLGTHLLPLFVITS